MTVFDPDGTGTQLLLWLLAIACVLGFAWFGHRLGTRSIRHALSRLAVLLTAVMISVLAVTATLNAHYGWYSSWSDLKADMTGESLTGTAHIYGATPKERQKERQEAAAHDRVTDEAEAKEFAAQRTSFLKGIPRPEEGADGVWFKRTVPGIPMKGKDIGRVMIWVPTSYFSHPNRTYPVIEAFHGIPGGTLDYERVFFLDHIVSKAVSDKVMTEPIIVVPQAMPDGIDTECVNGGGLTMETWLTKTVPDYIVHNLRAKAGPSSWLALGASAGGWCAAMSGLLHPDRYGAIASLGGYFKPEFNGWNPFAKSGVPAQYDLIKRVHDHPTSQDIWLLISGADKVSDTSTVEFAQQVRSPNSLTTMTYPHAGHRVDVWVQALPSVMKWIGKTLPGFAPAT